MSPDMKRSETKRPDRTAEGAHERACLLAAESIDAPLQPTDAAWLAGHLGRRGRKLKAGQPVITGSIIETQFPVAGDVLVFEVDGMPPCELRVVA